MELDGTTLLRYAHIYRQHTSGGTEQYLRQLNETLMCRNRMTIVQMHLVDGAPGSDAIHVERHGMGRIVWVPVVAYQSARSLRSLRLRLRQLVNNRSGSGSHPSVSFSAVLKAAGANWGGHFRYPTMIDSDRLVSALDEYHVDLVLLHWLSYDVGTLLRNALSRGIPYAVIHHFDNSRLGRPSNVKWLKGAAAVAGVSTRNVPPSLRHRFVNLSDAVDTEFFSPACATSVTRPTGFLVLLAGRLVEGKGHKDLLLATGALVATGAEVSVAFAGGMESPALKMELEQTILEYGLRDRVRFLGRLSTDELRNWYGAADVVVLPSSSEGLPRVLLEAQAMERPVIGYGCGGVPEAIVDTETGFVVRPGDHVALAARLKQLLERPDERVRLGRAGRRFVMTHYTMHGLVRRHETFCADLLTKRPTSRGVVTVRPDEVST